MHRSAACPWSLRRRVHTPSLTCFESASNHTMKGARGIVNLSRIGLTDPQYTLFTLGHKPIILGVDQPSFR